MSQEANRGGATFSELAANVIVPTWPVPIRQLVLKVQGDCNMACPDCYVYNAADQSWRDKPLQMDERVLQRSAERMAEHAETHSLPTMQVIYHGGEPLMNGAPYFRQANRIIRAAMPSGTVLKFSMQTNGVLLSKRVLDIMLEEGIRLGVSLDGAKDVNDAMRPLKGGRGTYDIVTKRIKMLSSERYRSIFAGISCTIDPTSDPIGTFETLAELDPPVINFLIKHATWEAPPEHASPMTGEWILRAFKHWAQRPASAPGQQVLLFDSLVSVLWGGPSRVEHIGLSPSAMAVIETDGSFEQEDSLKVVKEGEPATGLNVFEHSLDDVLQLPQIRDRQIGVAALSDTCKACPIVKMCGGGHYAHRYSEAAQFKNPSVYCEDLKVLIGGAHRHLVQLAQRQK